MRKSPLPFRSPPLLLLLALLVPACSGPRETSRVNDDDDDDSGGSSNDDDSGEDPTPGSCSEFVAPDVPSLEPDPNCMNLPESNPGPFGSVIEWQWDVNPLQPGYTGVMATPTVANLTDDNGDGIIDETDVPDIVFTSYPGSGYNAPGALTAISGDGNGTLWSILTAGGHNLTARSATAIGDIDADGLPDVCIPGYDIAVVCVEGATGAFKWAGGSELGRLGGVSMADLEGDGLVEVILGRQVFAHDGTLRWVGESGRGSSYYTELSDVMSFAVDLDGDGTLEVIAGNTIYDHLGVPERVLPVEDGIPALGDISGDDTPEIVISGNFMVSVFEADGTLVWQQPNPDSGRGGAATVADFDGDRRLEIGVATSGHYTVFDTDGEILWSNVTDDSSSGSTGSAVFDFDGDGTNEVVYGDEHTLFVYDGGTGAVRMQADGHRSPTGRENPIIVDVDNDARTEIVVPSSGNTAAGDWRGITVLGSAAEPWAPARPIWNQIAYHITNVNNDASIPQVQTPNWSSWNSFRTAGTEVGPSHWLADLKVEPPALCLEECRDDRVLLYVPLGNGGLAPSPSSSLQLSRIEDGGTVEIDQAPIPELLPGSGALLGPFELTSAQWGDELFVLIDAPDAVNECDESGNLVPLGPWPCE